MATIRTNVTRTFKDLDLNFNIHPVKKDINKHVGELAVVNSIKNLVLTNHYERPFRPNLGSNLRRLLFENADKLTATLIEREIEQVVNNFEPRARIQKVTATPSNDESGFNVKMEFFVVNRAEPISITFFLERIR